MNRNFQTFISLLTSNCNGLQAVICFFSVVYGYGYGKVPERSTGKMVGLFTIGTTMYTCVLFVVNIQLAVVIQVSLCSKCFPISVNLH